MIYSWVALYQGYRKIFYLGSQIRSFTVTLNTSAIFTNVEILGSDNSFSMELIC